MKTKVAINGFGRIGRLALRIAMQHPNLEIVAINSRASTESHAHLFKYDSTYGIYEGKVEAKGEDLFVDGHRIKVFQFDDPKEIPWGEAKVEVVFEATGVFRKKAEAAWHLHDTVKKVIISAPGKEVDGTFVMGVNEKKYDPKKHHIVSNASCTTNCLAPVCKVLQDKFGIEEGLMTTIHAYTSDQNLLDNSHKDLRRARAANLSMIPTSTGAAEAISEVIPELAGKLSGIAVRIPTPTSSLVDLTVNLSKKSTVGEVNAAFKAASKKELKGILGYSEEPLVSVDYKGSTFSGTIDALSTEMIGPKMLKVLAWYDNEWGYTCRLVDLMSYISKF
ncbi:MAG: type I glyceraldehyde-3-phosphate dehydrogenase [Candidatus Gracilibacteria bacterium]|nr:type I glyceraldehyde-3-phosphate dehydrogenase [Candidatus Gracilibacteria bacterium]